MTDSGKEYALSFVLLAVGLVWVSLVWSTIPPAFDEGTVGPRAFPLVLGLILVTLTLILLGFTVTRSRTTRKCAISSGKVLSEYPKIEWLPALLLTAEICAYGFLLEKIGFLLATPIVVLAVMGLNLRIRSPKRLLGMAFGLTVGCWLIFQKVMGIYLASGTWINLG